MSTFSNHLQNIGNQGRKGQVQKPPLLPNQKSQQRKSNAGRKPIVYRVDELERQNMVYLVCGETGVVKPTETGWRSNANRP